MMQKLRNFLKPQPSRNSRPSHNSRPSQPSRPDDPAAAEAAAEVLKQQQGGESIIQGILQEARDEAARITAQAEKSAAQREKSWSITAKRLQAEAEKEAAEKHEEIIRTGESRLKIEEKKRRLQLSEQAAEEVLNEALRSAETMVKTKEYRQVLENLITEAALGIQTDQAAVSSSVREIPLITEDLLQAAENRVRQLSGRSIKLVPAEGQPRPGQGVLLTSLDGTVAFSNQIRIRLLRYQSEIRRLIYRKLLSAGEGKNSQTAKKDFSEGDSAE